MVHIGYVGQGWCCGEGFYGFEEEAQGFPLSRRVFQIIGVGFVGGDLVRVVLEWEEGIGKKSVGDSR